MINTEIMTKYSTHTCLDTGNEFNGVTTRAPSTKSFEVEVGASIDNVTWREKSEKDNTSKECFPTGKTVSHKVTGQFMMFIRFR